MTFDLHRILESKRAFRRELASRDIVEKLAMLDAMRERALVLRGGRAATENSGETSAIHEDPVAYRSRSR